MKKNFFRIWLVALIVYATLLILAFRALPDGRLHVYFLDVGQGDSILVRTPNNQSILIDGGPSDKVLTELSDVLSFFERQLDLVILTHAHSDHINGLVSVLKRYRVEKVLISGVLSYGPYYDEFLRIINEKKIPLLIAESGRDFDLGNGVFLDVVYPVRRLLGEKIGNLNNASIVARLLYGGNTVLLTGDAEEESEREQLLTDFDLDADVLKVAHHGSRTASSAAYLKSVNPEIAVIQCGKENKFNHPHDETLLRLFQSGVERIYRNDLHGRVRLSFGRRKKLF